MKFLDRHTGMNISLHKLTNTDYWHDLEGDLYEIDLYSGECEKVNAAHALISLQLNESPKNGYCPICDDRCLKSRSGAFQRKSYDQFFRGDPK